MAHKARSEKSPVPCPVRRFEQRGCGRSDRRPLLLFDSFPRWISVGNQSRRSRSSCRHSPCWIKSLKRTSSASLPKYARWSANNTLKNPLSRWPAGGKRKDRFRQSLRWHLAPGYERVVPHMAGYRSLPFRRLQRLVGMPTGAHRTSSGGWIVTANAQAAYGRLHNLATRATPALPGSLAVYRRWRRDHLCMGMVGNASTSRLLSVR
jgi:hypothetical protein